MDPCCRVSLLHSGRSLVGIIKLLTRSQPPNKSFPTNTASVSLVMGCPNATEGVRLVTERATKFRPQSLITAGGVAVGVGLVITNIGWVSFSSLPPPHRHKGQGIPQCQNNSRK